MSSLDEIKKVLAYAAAGGVAAVVDIGIFTALFHQVDNHVVLAAFSFMIAAVVNYCLSSFYVFQTSLSFKRFLLFLYFAAIGFVINVSLTIAALSLISTNPAVAKLFGVGVAFFFNYVLNRTLVFSGPRLSAPSS